MKSEYQTKSGHMMKAMNLWSMLFLGVALGKEEDSQLKIAKKKEFSNLTPYSYI